MCVLQLGVVQQHAHPPTPGALGCCMRAPLAPAASGHNRSACGGMHGARRPETSWWQPARCPAPPPLSHKHCGAGQRRPIGADTRARAWLWAVVQMQMQVVTQQKFRRGLPEKSSMVVTKNSLMKVAAQEQGTFTMVAEKGCTVRACGAGPQAARRLGGGGP